MERGPVSMIGTNHLTGETLAQDITFPGQAHFAIPGNAKVCRDCWFWEPKRPSDQKAVCGKAASMMRGRPVAVPRYATACKFFTETAPEDYYLTNLTTPKDQG